MALIVEQAGGAVSTGRARIVDLAPRALHQRVPLILGSKQRVDYIDQKHRWARLQAEPAIEPVSVSTKA